MARTRSAALCLSLLLLACDGQPAARRAPLGAPPAPLPVGIAGRYELWVGRPTTDREARGARWCFIDVSVVEGELVARASRPGVAVRCDWSEFTSAGVVKLRLARLPDEDEAVGEDPGAEARPLREQWVLEGRFGQEASHEPVGEVEPDDADVPAKVAVIRGAATVTPRSDVAGRPFSTRFTARRLPNEE